jgi:hypothetical protein
MPHSVPENLFFAGIGCHDPTQLTVNKVALSSSETLAEARKNSDQRLFAIGSEGPFSYGDVRYNFAPRDEGGELTPFLEPWARYVPGTYMAVCGIGYLSQLRSLGIDNVLGDSFVPIIEDGSLGSQMSLEDFFALSERILNEAIQIFDSELRATQGQSITKKGEMAFKTMPWIQDDPWKTRKLLRLAVKGQCRSSQERLRENADLLLKGFPDNFSKIGISTVEEIVTWVGENIRSILAS